MAFNLVRAATASGGRVVLAGVCDGAVNCYSYRVWTALTEVKALASRLVFAKGGSGPAAARVVERTRTTRERRMMVIDDSLDK